jgi:hypothetical protein
MNRSSKLFSSKLFSSKGRRTLKYESLERRELFAADMFHGTSHESNSHHYESGHVASLSISSNSTSNGNNSKLKAEFRGSTGAKVEFEIEKDKVEINIEKALPRTTYPVTLSGNTIATLVTGSRGKASLKIAATTTVASALAGDVVTVSGIGSGILSLHGSSQSNNSLGSSKLTASLTGLGTGKAEFETKGTKQKFEIEMRGLSPNTTYDVTIDGVLVGKLSTYKSGKTELKFDNSKGRPFPANFPTITASSVINIGTATSGSVLLHRESAAAIRS